MLGDNATSQEKIASSNKDKSKMLVKILLSNTHTEANSEFPMPEYSTHKILQ